MKKFNLSRCDNIGCFGIAMAFLFGLLVSGCTSAQTKSIRYDDYGKPLSNTRGEFIVNQGVNLRSEANTNSQVIGVLPAGETVMVKGVTHGYYRITFDGKTGYSWHKFFTPKQ